jgi:uncharacterized protein
MTRGARVPMRDGVHLNAVVYRPRETGRGAGQPVPAVLELTPYTTDGVHRDGLWFAREGFAYVVADVRGRGESDGLFTPMVGDGPDGYDLVEWCAAQPWCDGRVVLYGGSYTGNNQWSIMGEQPPALRAASPAAAFAGAIDVPRGGVPNIYDLMWRSYVWGRGSYFGSGADRGLWHQGIRDAIDAGRPVWTAAEDFRIDLDELAHRQFEQPQPGAAWADHFITDDQVARIDVPVLTVTGTHDDCLQGTLHHWARFTALSSAEVTARSTLLIGPWDHAGTDSGSPTVGDLTFDRAAGLDLRAMRAAWFRHVLDGVDPPPELTDRVVWYQAGEEAWHGAPTLAEAGRGRIELFGISGPGQNDVFHSGWLSSQPPGGDGPDYVVTHDPAARRTLDLEMIPRPNASPDNPHFPLSYNNLMMTQGGNDPTNQVFSVSLAGEGVVYHTAMLDEPIAVTGTPRLRLSVTCSGDDFDLAVLLHEIRPDGGAIFVSSHLLRLSWRDGGDTRDLLLPDEPADLDITDFRWAARTIATGSRLRLTIRDASSIFLSSDPEGRSTEVRELRIHHRQSAPFVLTVPLATA